MSARPGVTDDHEQREGQVEAARRGVCASVSGEGDASLLCLLDGCVHEVHAHGAPVDLSGFGGCGAEGCEVLVEANEWGRVRTCVEGERVCVVSGVGVVWAGASRRCFVREGHT